MAFLTLLLGLSAGCIYASYNSLRSQFRNAELFEVARLIETSKKLDGDFLKTSPRLVRDAIGNGACDDMVLRASITLAIVDLTRQNPTVDFDTWGRSLDEARRLLRISLGCTPHDGNLWIRLALVERAAVFVPDRILPLIAMSAKLSPAEFGVITGRFEMWRIAEKWLTPDAAQAEARDVDSVMRRAKPADVALLLARADGEIGRKLRRMVMELPQSRVQALDKAGVFEMGPPMKKKTATFLDFMNSRGR